MLSVNQQTDRFGKGNQGFDQPRQDMGPLVSLSLFLYTLLETFFVFQCSVLLSSQYNTEQLVQDHQVSSPAMLRHLTLSFSMHNNVLCLFLCSITHNYTPSYSNTEH